MNIVIFIIVGSKSCMAVSLSSSLLKRHSPISMRPWMTLTSLFTIYPTNGWTVFTVKTRVEVIIVEIRKESEAPLPPIDQNHDLNR